MYTLLETTTAKMSGQPGEEPGVSPSHVDAVCSELNLDLIIIIVSSMTSCITSFTSI